MSVEQVATANQQEARRGSTGAATATAGQPVPASIARALLETLKSLPPEKQQAVLDYAEFLEQKSTPPEPHHSFIGLFADEGTHISEEEIAQARREIWGNFPARGPDGSAGRRYPCSGLVRVRAG